MSQIELRLVTNIIEIFYITYSLSIVQNKVYKLKDFCICILLYLPSFFLLKDNDWRIYIIKHVYMLFIFIVYLLKCEIEVNKYIPLICMLLSVCGIVKVVIAAMGSITALFLYVKFLSLETLGTLSAIFYMIVFCWLMIKTMKSRVVNIEFTFTKKCIAYLIYFIVICAKIPFLYTDIQDALALKMVLISIICCTVIFFIISRIEKHNADKERALIEENNKILSTKLHKAQEILPAMVQAVSDVVENSGKEMEGQQARKLLAEMTDMYGQNLKENSKEDLQLKNFCSTGLALLDQQLKGYQIEASDKNINMDIFVQAPINEIMKKDGIDQWKLQRAVGDMVRNAFRVEEKEDKKCRLNKHILLIIGCQYEDVLEISVLDNGKPFPLYVIETFGKRGVTTGGTGNGLADLVEFADETNASIWVEEFAWETDSFTKKVSIKFDCRRLNYFNSPREAFIKNVFWNKTE